MVSNIITIDLNPPPTSFLNDPFRKKKIDLIFKGQSSGMEILLFDTAICVKKKTERKNKTGKKGEE